MTRQVAERHHARLAVSELADRKRKFSLNAVTSDISGFSQMLDIEVTSNRPLFGKERLPGQLQKSQRDIPPLSNCTLDSPVNYKSRSKISFYDEFRFFFFLRCEIPEPSYMPPFMISLEGHG